MGTYNIHAGHGNAGGLGCGAVGILDESVENRKVKDALIEYMRNNGNVVHDCTFNGNGDAQAILEAIVARCNRNKVDLDISIHLNSGRNDKAGDGKTGGVEVYGYDDQVREIGNTICANISNILHIANRGFKINPGFYVLKKTVSKAIIIECAFVDDADDAKAWDAKKCARAIAVALGVHVSSSVQNVNVSASTQAQGQETHKHKIGESVEWSTSYLSPTETIGLANAKGGSGHGTIIEIVQGQAKYRMSTGVFCNDGDIRGAYTAPSPQPQAGYYPRYTGDSKSLVDALQAVNVDSSFSSRQKIASKNGINNYRGTEEQNTKLLSLLKKGKLIR